MADYGTYFCYHILTEAEFYIRRDIKYGKNSIIWYVFANAKLN